MRNWRRAHPAIALLFFSAACAMTFGEASAQVATFTTQRYPLLGNTHIAVDLNGDGRIDLAGAVSSRGRSTHRASRFAATLAVRPRVP